MWPESSARLKRARHSLTNDKIRMMNQIRNSNVRISPLRWRSLCLLGTLFLLAADKPAEPQRLAGFQGGGPLLGQAAPIAPPPMKLRWQYKTDEVEKAGVSSAPTIAGGVLYLADSRGTLHAIDLASGKAKWKFTTENGFGTTPL